MSRTDRAIGIVLGIVVGLIALVLFVFLGSTSSIDAPSLDDRPGYTQPTQERGQP